MQRKGITFLIIAIIVLTGICLCFPTKQVETEYLRIHVRANSNSTQDQALKMVVKDAIVEYLTPFIAECDTKKKAEVLLTDRLTQIESVANHTIEKRGYSYKSKASVRVEKFPTRKYGALELKSGYYQALIVELGEGVGDNWWCVVYPPLCFTGETKNVVYRSKILDIISAFFQKGE